MKTIEQITREYYGGDLPKPIPELCDPMLAVARMQVLLKKLRFEEEDLLELCACAGIGVVACWRQNYRFCRDGGITSAKLFQDAALLGMMSEEGAMIKTWAEERLPEALAEVDACKNDKEGARLWIAYCAAAYRYGMALEQQILDMKMA